MDFTRALSFPFDDDDWIVKFVVGTLMTLAGFILPFILLGYEVNVARHVMRGKERPLPGTDNIGEVIADGLMALIAGLIYAIPAIVLGCILAFMGGLLGNSDLGGTLFACLTCCMSGFFILYGIVATALFWMGVIRYAETGNFSEFLRFSDLWDDVRANLGTLIGLLLYSIVLGLLVSVASIFLAITCVGIPALTFYSQVVSGHLIGQAGQEIVHGY
jgi:hypothetical protein